MVDKNQLTTRVEQISGITASVLPYISEMDDAQLVKTAISALYLERFAFVLRGACAAELRRRIPTRLAGGRGKRDKEGIGIKAYMARLAKEIGVSVKTLATDARISEIFFSSDETVLAREHSLSREYYVIALSAPDPLAAIRVVQSKIAEPEYKLQQFRSYVRELKQEVPVNKVPSERETLRLLHVYLPQEVHLSLMELIQRSGHTKEVVVANAIRALHSGLAERGAKGSTARGQHRGNENDSTQNDRQLRLQIE
jgi:hypothetical protein